MGLGSEAQVAKDVNLEYINASKKFIQQESEALEHAQLTRTETQAVLQPYLNLLQDDSNFNKDKLRDKIRKEGLGAHRQKLRLDMKKAQTLKQQI